MLLGFPVIFSCPRTARKGTKKAVQDWVCYRSYAPRGNAVSNAPALRFTSKQRWSVRL